MTENEMMNGWTFEETIKTAENLMEEENNVFKWDVLRHLRDFAEHYKEQLEQYIAIGLTPELIEAMQGHNIALINDLGEYQQIGTIEELKALKEKSEPKEPDYQGDGCWGGHVVIDTWICPSCGKHYEVDYDDYDYCPNCGQHIDHSGLTEDD